MARTLAVINTAANDTFFTLITRVNDLVNAFSTEIVTANNDANGATTVGNSFVVGTFGSNTLVTTTLRGGNVQSSANLAVSSNLTINASSILYIGNSTSNITANASHIVIGNSTISGARFLVGNSTVNAQINALGLIVGNVVVNSSSLLIGNSTVNSKLTSTVLNIGTSTVNSTVLAAGANVIVNTTGLFVGNSTVNNFINSSAHVIGNVVINGNGLNYTANASINSVSNITFNAHTLIVQANLSFGNLSLTTSGLSAGNSTVNTTVNSSGVGLSGHIITSSSYTTSNTSVQVVDSFLSASFTSAEYLIEQSTNTSYQLSKLLLVNHPTLNTFITEYGVVSSNGSLGTFSANANTTHVLLNFTPSTAVTNLKIVKTLLKA